MKVEVRRIYDTPDADAPDAEPGHRVLVDRIWPRGITKVAAALDEWCRDVAPSAELHRWYGHRPERFGTFRERYLAELDAPDRAREVTRLRALPGPKLVLLTATRDVEFSHAKVLAERLGEN